MPEITSMLRRLGVGVFTPVLGTEPGAAAAFKAEEGAAMALLGQFVELHPWLPRTALILTRLRDDRRPWVTREREVIALADITPQHAKNILGVVGRSELRRALLSTAFVELSVSSVGPMGPSGDMAQLAVDQEMDMLLDMDPDVFYERLPLVRLLRARAS